MEERFKNIRQINDEKALKARDQQRHDDSIAAQHQTRDTILRAFQTLISFLEGHTGKTEIVNQLKEIGTPDALKVADAVKELHETIKTHENTDLSEVTSILKSLLQETKAIPKSATEVKIPDTVTVSNQTDYSSDLKHLLAAVKGIKLVAEAPKVTVTPTTPDVHVDVNIDQVKTGLEAVVSAVKAITIPEVPTTDLSTVEKKLDKSNELLEAIRTRPTGSTGGSTSFKSADGKLAYAELDDMGRLPVTPGAVTSRYDIQGTTIYTGEAPIGSSDAAPVWTITKFDLADMANVSGKLKLNGIWNNRGTEEYA
jgi:hypothetical protein